MYYALRFQVLPGPDVAGTAARVADFCDRAGIGEVVLITNAEEHFGGLAADEDVWFDTVATAAPVLRAAGLAVSLNPWVTVGHADRGRRDRLGFAPMVSPHGEVAAAQASFACPRWRSWLAGHYGRYAALGLRVLWLEDDFRYHNHAPLTWGGGFEPEMLERFAELAGEPVKRADLVDAITAPGPPHPWRALLARTWFEAQLAAVAAVRDAVAGRSALGLMSSTLGIASVEGRDWRRLLTALGPGAVHRPHYAPYTDAVGRELAWSVAMLELQRPLRPAGTEVAPEVENYPFTSWSKSDTQTWSEMVACALTGADGLLLDVVPFTAGSPDRFPAVGAMLRDSAPHWSSPRPRASRSASASPGTTTPPSTCTPRATWTRWSSTRPARPATCSATASRSAAAGARSTPCSGRWPARSRTRTCPSCSRAACCSTASPRRSSPNAASASG
ncbi:hypothetical protein ACFQV2_07085 [Actinokineospora soli]|uniref:Uncharacterized protein n=1 Tax=Actinokineospora soli TaxID=1048753 RepID=A0ABW2TKR3_9PSEU